MLVVVNEPNTPQEAKTTVFRALDGTEYALQPLPADLTDILSDASAEAISEALSQVAG